MPSPRSLENAQKYSADVFGFLIPSWNHVFFGHFARNLDLGIFIAGFEGTVYIGPVILILAFVGFARGMAIWPRWTLRASVAAIVFYLLSLGPRLRFFGRQSGYPRPGVLIYGSRFCEVFSAPARFDVIVMLCMAILCAAGMRVYVGPIERNVAEDDAIAAILMLLLADLLTIPFPNSSSFDAVLYPDSATIVRPCELPPAAQNGTVLTLPLQEWPYNVKAMGMQMATTAGMHLWMVTCPTVPIRSGPNFNDFRFCAHCLPFKKPTNHFPARSSLLVGSSNACGSSPDDASSDKETAFQHDSRPSPERHRRVRFWSHEATIRYLEEVLRTAAGKRGKLFGFPIGSSQDGPGGTGQRGERR